MSCRAAIFDLDGTLLDSMSVWSGLCREFLLRHGIDDDVDLDGKLGVLSIRSALEYVIREFSLPVPLDDACRETWDIVSEFYREKAELKPGIIVILDRLKAKNIPCGVITATESGLVREALARVGLQNYFREIFSCADLQTSKRSPEIFHRMAAALGASPSETLVFEDALYAARTAGDAGFQIAAVYDPSEKSPEKLAEISDWYCREWSEFPLEVL